MRDVITNLSATARAGRRLAVLALGVTVGLAEAQAAVQAPPAPAALDSLERADVLLEAGDLAAARALLESLVAADPAQLQAWRRLGRTALLQDEPARAVEALERVVQAPESTRDWRSQYNLACAQARRGALDAAFSWLRRAAASGSIGPALLDTDPDLAALRRDRRWAALHEQAARAAEPCRFQPESRQLDFWLGEWRVRSRASAQPAGHSRIEKVLGECVLLEHWSGVNGWSGKSFNLYDTRSRTWRQTWVDQSGRMTEFVDGRAGEDSLSFRSEPLEEDGQRVERRLTFTRLGPDRVRQHGERSQDGGRTWSDEYDLIYERQR